MESELPFALKIQLHFYIIYSDLMKKDFNSGCFFRIVEYNMDNDKIKIKY